MMSADDRTTIERRQLRMRAIGWCVVRYVFGHVAVCVFDDGFTLSEKHGGGLRWDCWHVFVGCVVGCGGELGSNYWVSGLSGWN